jgi:L-ascorbate oxidase
MQALSCTGALVLDDCGSSPYDYDDERILLFQDYFQHKGREMIQGLASVPFSWAGETHGIMLNGRGVASGHTSIQGFPGEANGFFGSRRFSTEGGINGAVEDDQIKPPSDCTLPVIDVEPGKTYRLRFIGATGLSFLAMGFEDHSNLTIVQVDGSEYNAPVDVDYLQLGAGQRFDVVLQTKTAEELAESGDKTTFYLQFETRDRPDPYRGYGVLRYSLDTPVPPAPSDPVLSLPTDTANWLEFTLQPLDPSCNQAPTASDVTRRVILDAVQKLDPETGRLVWELAHLSLTESTSAHPTPVLIEIYRHGQAAIPNYTAALANHGWDPATKLFPAKTDEVLEIVIQNTGSEWAGAAGLVESHPFHAHGQHYYDVGSGPGKYDAEANDAKLERLGYRPVKRDTTMLFRYGDGRAAPGEPAGWRAWRLRTDHPGVWMVHCHISAHVVMGEFTEWNRGCAPLHGLGESADK